MNLLESNGSFYSAAERNCVSAYKAVERTLDDFQITENRKVCGEAILRLYFLNSDRKIIPRDAPAKKLFEMLDCFKKKMQDETIALTCPEHSFAAAAR